MIYVLCGPDDYSVSQALEKIKNDMGGEAVLSMGTTVLEGQNLSFDELKVTCETMPFMTDKRLVIVNGLIGRFESQTKTRRSSGTAKKTRKSPKQEEAQRFGDYLAGGIPDTTVLVLQEGVILGENPVFKSLSGKATIRSYSLPKDADLREWVQKRVDEESGSISQKAVSLLARFVGNDLWAMANEVNKLVLFADGRTIEEEDVKLIVGQSQHFSVFDMVDAILEFRIEQSEKILQEQFLAGAAPVYLLYMLSRQVQLIVRAGEMKKNRVSSRDMQMKLGMKSEWVLKKTLEQAGRYSLPRLREVYQTILDTDIAIKTGKYDGELALNVLVAELCRRGEKRSGSAGAVRR